MARRATGTLPIALRGDGLEGRLRVHEIWQVELDQLLGTLLQRAFQPRRRTLRSERHSQILVAPRPPRSPAARLFRLFVGARVEYKSEATVTVSYSLVFVMTI